MSSKFVVYGEEVKKVNNLFLATCAAKIAVTPSYQLRNLNISNRNILAQFECFPKNANDESFMGAFLPSDGHLFPENRSIL